MAFKATYDNVMVRMIDTEAVTSGGIVITSNSTKTFNKGEVVYVGEGKKTKDGKILPLAVKVGDVVLFGLTSGTSIRVNEEALVVLKEDDIFAVDDQ